MCVHALMLRKAFLVHCQEYMNTNTIEDYCVWGQVLMSTHACVSVFVPSLGVCSVDYEWVHACMQLPDGNIVHVGPDRFNVPEILFKPVHKSLSPIH